MATRLRLMTVFTIAAALAAPAMAQNAGTTNMEILRQKIKADKKLVVAQNLGLTDTEGVAFWPVYESYQKDLQQINQRLAPRSKPMPARTTRGRSRTRRRRHFSMKPWRSMTPRFN